MPGIDQAQGQSLFLPEFMSAKAAMERRALEIENETRGAAVTGAAAEELALDSSVAV